MIGNVTRGTSFRHLVSYLETGRSRNELGRVEWTAARNLPTGENTLAGVRLMEAAARQSVRVEKPVYHLSISFDPSDPVSRRAMCTVAERTLQDLGLGEHQALVFAHRDTEHPHIHIVVNRVHPDTGRAWDNAHDYARVERSLRAQERELGLRQVAGHHARAEEQQRPDRSEALSRGQRQQQVRSGDVPFVEYVRGHAGDALREASTWREVDRRLEEHGLRIEARGRGLIITDGRQQVKASSVARDVSRPSLERRLGPWTERIREPAAAERPGASPAYQERTAAPAGRPVDTVQILDSAREAAHFRRPWETYRALRDEFRAVYVAPIQARRAFLAVADREGAARAAATLRERPETFGTLRAETGVPARAAGAVELAHDFASARAARPRLVMKELATKLREWADAEAERALDAKLMSALWKAEAVSKQYGEARQHLRRSITATRESAAGVYRDPAQARRSIRDAVRRIGTEPVAKTVRERPEAFGALRTVERRKAFGLWRVQDATAARDEAAALSSSLRAVAQVWERIPLPAERQRADASKEAAEGALRQSRATRSGRSTAVAEQEVRGILRRIEQRTSTSLGAVAMRPAQQARAAVERVFVPPQLRQLVSMVQAPHLALTKAAWNALRTELKREHER